MEKNPPDVEVLIGLYHEKDFTKPVAEKTIKVTESPFRKFELVLPNPFFEGRATFSISIGPGKEVNLDGLSLMPSDSISGWRKEVIKALHKVNPRLSDFQVDVLHPSMIGGMVSVHTPRENIRKANTGEDWKTTTLEPLNLLNCAVSSMQNRLFV